jgi:hypothetical protein
MKCHEIQELFSPWLDNRISPEEAAQFKQHLLECPDCQLKLQEWQQVSDILKSFAANTEGLKAPDGFEERVMQQIAEIEAQPRWLKINRTVKRFAALAAAAAVLTYGTVDLYPRVFNNPPPINVAEHQNPDPANPTLNNNHSNDNTSNSSNSTNSTNNDHNNNLPGQNSGAPDQPLSNGETPGPAATPGTEVQPRETMQNGNTGTNVEPLSHTQPPGQNNPESMIAANSSPANVSPMVFLNKPRTISSHLLRLKVTDLALAQKQAEAAAKSTGAKYQVFSVQSSGENQRVILRITVENNRSKALINTLSSKGVVIESHQDSQDITQKFADTLEQYRTLSAELNENTDEKQRASLHSQLKTLEQQLTAWDEEAEKQVIMLTLEV